MMDLDEKPPLSSTGILHGLRSRSVVAAYYGGIDTNLRAVIRSAQPVESKQWVSIKKEVHALTFRDYKLDVAPRS